MNLVPGICTQCGSNLEVDPSKEAAVCSFCGTPFITEKVINNYNTTNVTNNVTNIESLHADVVKISDERGIDSRVKAAETFMSLGKYEAAEEIFAKLTEECPYDHRGWWGRILTETRNFQTKPERYIDIGVLEGYYRSAVTVVTDEKEKKKMEDKFLPFISECNAKLDKLVSDYEQRIRDISAQSEAEKEKSDQIIQALGEEQKTIKEVDPPGCFFLVGFLVPVIGWLLLGIYWIYDKIIGNQNEKIEEYNDELRRKRTKEESRLYEIYGELAHEADDIKRRLIYIGHSQRKGNGNKTVILLDYGKRKLDVIGEIRKLTELGLKEANELSERTPFVLKKDVSESEAEQIKNTFTALGAVIEIN